MLPSPATLSWCIQMPPTWGWALSCHKRHLRENVQSFFLSRKLTGSEQKYVAIEKEALAMQWAIEEFLYYLWGQWFTVVTNHAPLQWLAHMKDTNPRLMQWYLALQPYAFSIRFQKGTEYANADYFS